MAAEQANLETIADNLANADVAGFKGAVQTFAPLGDENGAVLGTVALGSYPVFTQGKLVRSGGPFDLAIDGTGFFAVMDQRGRVAYTREGQFSRSAEGMLTNAAGWHLAGVRIPSDAVSVDVASDGAVIARTAAGKRICGHIRLAEFAAPERLAAAGGTLYFATHASGKPHYVTAGNAGGPSLRFGALEQSNVSIVEAMMQILAAQRAYEANAKGVQAADEMMRIADNLSRE